MVGPPPWTRQPNPVPMGRALNVGWDRPADDEDPGGGLALSPQLACHTAGGLQGSPEQNHERHLHLPLEWWSPPLAAWASLLEAPSGTWLPFLPPPRWPPHGMRSKGSPAMPSLWEKGHRKRGWASDPRAPSQPHSPGGASGDPAGTFQSLPAHCAQAQLPLQHRGEEEGIGFCCHKQAPESHQLPGQGLAAEVPSAHGFTGWKSQCRGWSLSGRNPPPHP